MSRVEGVSPKFSLKVLQDAQSVMDRMPARELRLTKILLSALILAGPVEIGLVPHGDPSYGVKEYRGGIQPDIAFALTLIEERSVIYLTNVWWPAKLIEIPEDNVTGVFNEVRAEENGSPE